MALMLRRCALVLISLVVRVNGNAFLQMQQTRKTLKPVAQRDVEKTLLTELSGLVSTAHIQSIEEELRPSYAAVRKNGQGRLDPSTVRYVLHRFFSRRHGWYVQGLDPAGDMWEISSPTSIMEELAPHYIQKLFDVRLHNDGLGLHELAIFAATLLDLIHNEAASHLETIYTSLGLPTVGPVPRAQSDLAIKAYLMEYVLGISFNGTELRSQMEGLEPEVAEVYPAWEDTTLWAQDLFLAHAEAQYQRNPFVRHWASFDDSASYVKELGHHFGSFQNLECSALKNKLVEMEVQGTGRVPLRQFYSGGLSGEWQFTESREYLRSLGVLDERDPQQPSVVISNYVNSQTNCLTPSSLYSVCCLDECERLLGHVEEEIADSYAVPSRIAEVVMRLQSDTVDAPRNLSTALLVRLDEIAQNHNGRVLLHGRLFAQWMHHAYPRECPFPHEAGTLRQVSPMEWMALTGLESPDVGQEELQKHLAEEGREGASFITALPWSAAEESLVGYKTAKLTQPTTWTRVGFRILAVYALMAALVIPLVREARSSAKKSSASAKLDKFLV